MRESSSPDAVPGATIGPSNPQEAISQEQQQFAEALGNALAEQWLQDHTADGEAADRTDAESRRAR